VTGDAGPTGRIRDRRSERVNSEADGPVICGLKFTHDGGVAVISGSRLVASVEIEKLDNRLRYTELDDIALADRSLRTSASAGRHRLVRRDGWGYGEKRPIVSSSLGGELLSLRVAPYRERDAGDGSLTSTRSTPSPGRSPGGVFELLPHHRPSAVGLLRKPVRANRLPAVVVFGMGVCSRAAYHIRPDGPTSRTWVQSLG